MYRYLGNKARIVDHIVDAVRRLAPPGAIVGDPMCGTATVAAALAEARYRVIASDELTFPVFHATTRLLVGREPSFSGAPGGSYSRALETLNALPPERALFADEYGANGSPRNGCRTRTYFTAKNAGKIDAVRGAIRRWRDSGAITELERRVLLHDLILAVNRVANIAGTYGYYRSTWNPAALRPLELRASSFTRTRDDHQVVQGRVEEIVDAIDADVLYLDPPYTKRQYAGNYHILETIAADDDPQPVGEGGLRDWYGQYSEFCSKRTAAAAFAHVLERVRAPHVLLSYSEDGLVPPEAMVALLSSYGSVRRLDIPVQRFRSNGGRRTAVVEHLYHLELVR